MCLCHLDVCHPPSPPPSCVRWYLGTIQEYDEEAKKHKILFEGGTVRDIELHDDDKYMVKFVKPTTVLAVSHYPPHASDEAPRKTIVKGVAPQAAGEEVEEGEGVEDEDAEEEEPPVVCVSERLVCVPVCLCVICVVVVCV